ncbi:MAG: STAS domain-containing protein [Eubacterium sp.]|nr:STAS domain-containing protein [Eubacterium sp.]
MNLTTEKNGENLIVHVSGDLNTLTAPELSDLLSKELSGVKNLTLDFAECDYVSSAGLRVLLATYKQLKTEDGTMKLTNVGEFFQKVLKDTCLDAVFEVE